MLKKLLPFLQKLKELKLPKLPNPLGFLTKRKPADTTTSIAPEGVSATPEQYSDLNLIVNTGGNPLANIKYNRVLVLLKLVILITMGIFIALVFLNNALSVRLNNEKRETDRIYKNIREYDTAIEKTRNISRRIQFYKKILKERPSLADKTRLIASIANDQTDIVKVSVTDKSFYLNAKGNNALMFAQILETYKASKRISEIRLKSARLVKDKTTKQNGFAIELEGNFK
jgi:hypothetical protein